MEPRVQRKYNYIVGIDFGTFSSSFSFAHKDDKENIITIDDWPNADKYGHQGRISSSIMYQYDNNGASPLEGSAFIKRNDIDEQVLYAFNLKLYLTDTENQPLMPEDDLTPVKLVSDYLQQLHKHCLHKMEIYFQENELKSLEVANLNNISEEDIYTPAFSAKEIRYVVSYPDNQADKEYQKKIKEALEMADIINSDDPEYRLQFITESEATAYYHLSLDKQLKSSPIPYVVCDIGGSVFGVSTIDMREFNKLPTVQSLTNFACTGFGNLQLDHSMKKYLKEKITASPEGSSIVTILYKKLFEFYIENIKLRFKENVEDYHCNINDIIHINDTTIRSNCFVNDNFVFSYDDMKKDIFDPVINGILESIDNVATTFEKKIAEVLVSGTIGGCQYLENSVYNKFSPRELKVTTVKNTELAVSKGLVVYGREQHSFMIPYIISKGTNQTGRLLQIESEGFLSDKLSCEGARKLKYDDIDYIIGLDFGNSFSGFAFTPVPKESQIPQNHALVIKDIKIVPVPYNSKKTPSTLYYSLENQYPKPYGIDFETKRRVDDVLLHHFRNLLFRDFDPEVDDKVLENLDYSRVIDAVANFFKYLIGKATKEVKTKNIRQTDGCLLFVITIPTMWSDEAKNAMKLAIQYANIIQNNDGITIDDRFLFITEAEAAALYCEKFYSKDFPMKTGQRFMICDAGGTTVNLTTFKVGHEENENNRLLNELVSSDNGKCGSLYLDENFKNYIVHQLNKHGVEYKKDGIESVVNEFIKSIKPFFEEPTEHESDDEDMTITLPQSLGIAINYEGAPGFIEDNQITIPFTDIDQIVFKPVIDKVLKLIEKQLKKLPEKERCLDAILLVGGFGQSGYLYKKICDTFEKKTLGAHFIGTPPNCELAICRGAVSFGLEPRMVSKTITRYTYGLQVKDTFNTLSSDNPDYKIIGYNNQEYCLNVFSEIVPKGTEINKGMVYIQKVFVTYPNNPLFVIYEIDKTGDDGNRHIISQDLEPIIELQVTIPAIKEIKEGDPVEFELHFEIKGHNIHLDIYHEGVHLKSKVTRTEPVFRGKYAMET